MRDKTFDNSIRDKVRAFEPHVPENVWANIEAGLDQKPLVSLDRGKNKFFWLRVAAVTLVFIGAGMFYINRPREVIYLTANGKKENIKAIVSSIESTTGQKPSGQENENKVEQIIRKPFVGQQKAAIEKAEEQALVAVLLEETNLTASAPVLEHPILAEEVKRPELNALYSSVQEKKLVNVFIDEQPGLIVLAREPSKDKKRFGVSDLLNYIVKPVNQGDQKVLSFADDDEGSIRVAVHLKALKIKL